MNVVIDRHVLANFRRRAWRRFPKEYMEALFGRKEGDTIYVSLFYPFPHTATVWHCHYEPEEIERLEVEAEALGLEYLGGVHTHTGLKTCAHPSVQDHLSGLEEDSYVEAILFMHRSGRPMSRLNFYIPTEPIQINYR